MSFRLVLMAACGPALLLTGAGCETGPPAGVTIRGKLLKGGQPMKVERPDIGLGMVRVELLPDGMAGAGPESTNAQADGSFEIVGAGRGVPPGRYKLTVTWWAQGPGNDGLNGAFSAEKTPLVVVAGEDQRGEVLDLGVIDLDQPPTAPLGGG